MVTGEVKRSESCSVVSDSAAPWTVQSVGFSRPESWRGWPFPSPGDLPNPGMEPRLPTLQEGSSPAEPPGKTKNTGVGSLSLLQLIFPTQESNWGLPHCRQILYQLSYQGSPGLLKIKACREARRCWGENPSISACNGSALSLLL